MSWLFSWLFSERPKRAEVEKARAALDRAVKDHIHATDKAAGQLEESDQQAIRLIATATETIRTISRGRNGHDS